MKLNFHLFTHTTPSLSTVLSIHAQRTTAVFHTLNEPTTAKLWLKLIVENYTPIYSSHFHLQPSLHSDGQNAATTATNCILSETISRHIKLNAYTFQATSTNNELQLHSLSKQICHYIYHRTTTLSQQPNLTMNNINLRCPMPRCNHVSHNQLELLKHLNNNTSHPTTLHLTDRSTCNQHNIFQCCHHTCPTSPIRFFSTLQDLHQHNITHHPPPTPTTILSTNATTTSTQTTLVIQESTFESSHHHLNSSYYTYYIIHGIFNSFGNR